MKNAPTTAILTTTATGIGIGVAESTYTIDTNFSEYFMLLNNGTDRNSKVKDTLYGLVDLNLKWLNKAFPCAGGANCPYLASAANYEAPCPTKTLNVSCPVKAWPDYDPMGQAYIPLVFGLYPEGGVGWTSITTITSYIGFFHMAPISSKLQ